MIINLQSSPQSGIGKSLQILTKLFHPFQAIPGSPGGIAKPSEKRMKKRKWGLELLGDLIKFPCAILLFSVLVYLLIKALMINGRLQIVLREKTPSFY